MEMNLSICGTQVCVHSGNKVNQNASTCTFDGGFSQAGRGSASQYIVWLTGRPILNVSIAARRELFSSQSKVLPHGEAIDSSTAGYLSHLTVRQLRADKQGARFENHFRGLQDISRRSKRKRGSQSAA